jgi:ParE toxin of type II toxin-antitoxin system, parDE
LATPPAFVDLGLAPRPPGAMPLVDSEWWRLRVGDLRVVCAIDDDQRLVIILRVARRNESTYRTRSRRPLPG